jgi:hypothetical protein
MHNFCDLFLLFFPTRNGLFWFVREWEKTRKYLFTREILREALSGNREGQRPRDRLVNSLITQTMAPEAKQLHQSRKD